MLTSNFRRRDDRLEQKAACSKGGTRAPYLTDKPAPEGQDQPTQAMPISAHKQMSGQGRVPRLPSFK
jgi:hypothetical protein